jgi:hypothetical protein
MMLLHLKVAFSAVFPFAKVLSKNSIKTPKKLLAIAQAF